jgi:hypothetical protein
VTRYASVIVHGVVVLVLAVLAAPFFFSAEGDGVAIGALFFLLPLLALGLPWSLPWLVVLSSDASLTVVGIFFAVLVLGGAATNIVLHHRWRQWRLRAKELGVRP